VRQLYLAATGQNSGKTTVALGLLAGSIDRGLRTGFMKPVGQRTVIENGESADEDAVLIRDVFGFPDSLRAMSPVHIPPGFTRAYIAGDVVEDLGARIRDAQATFSGHDLLMVEGTGHAGVGAVIGLSNAVVARMLGMPAIIISGGGIGRPIDEIVLNASHFAAHGVAVAGAIVNKLHLDGRPWMAETLERGLARHGIPLLGVLPYRPILSNPTLRMILEGVGAEVIHSGPNLDRVIDGVAIGAMEPHHVLEHVGPGTLVIVPGDREDVINALVAPDRVGRPRGMRDGAIGGGLGHPPARHPVSSPSVPPAAIGIVLTGGYRPRDAVLAAIRSADLFTVIVPGDTYTVARAVHDLLVKTHAADTEKIACIKRIVAEFLDVDLILAAAMKAAPPA
jgi:BioD-like phosphotransacetylase family protein